MKFTAAFKVLVGHTVAFRAPSSPPTATNPTQRNSGFPSLAVANARRQPLNTPIVRYRLSAVGRLTTENQTTKQRTTHLLLLLQRTPRLRPHLACISYTTSLICARCTPPYVVIRHHISCGVCVPSKSLEAPEFVCDSTRRPTHCPPEQ